MEKYKIPNLTDYESVLLHEDKKENTRSAYMLTAKQFLETIKNNPEKITQRSIDKFFSQYKDNSQNIKKMSLKCYINYLNDNGHNFNLKIKTKTVKKREPEYFNSNESKQFFNTIKTDTKRHKEYAMFMCMYNAGLRVGEVAGLKVSDIDFYNNRIKLSDSKAGKDHVLLKKELAGILERYIKNIRRKITPFGPDEYLFLTKFKKGFSKQGIEYLFDEILKKGRLTRTDIGKRLTPHSLRHTFAFRLRESGATIETIKELMRHQHIQTTLIYTHITNEEKKNALESI